MLWEHSRQIKVAKAKSLSLPQKASGNTVKEHKV